MSCCHKVVKHMVVKLFLLLHCPFGLYCVLQLECFQNKDACGCWGTPLHFTLHPHILAMKKKQNICIYLSICEETSAACFCPDLRIKLVFSNREKYQPTRDKETSFILFMYGLSMLLCFQNVLVAVRIQWCCNNTLFQLVIDCFLFVFVLQMPT